MSLLPNQSFVAPDKSLFARQGGGGGGGGGTDPSFSTITMNSQGAVILKNDGSGGSADLVGYTNNSATATSTTNFSVAFPSGYVPPGAGAGNGCWTIESQDALNSSYYGDLCAGRFVVAGNNSGTNNTLPTITADTSCGLILNGASTIQLLTSSLTLNGAPLSGGGVAPGANLPGLSTIGVSSIAGGVSITSGAGAGQGINIGNGVIALDNPGTSYQANLYYNASDSNVYLTGLSTHSVRIGSQSNTNAVQIGDQGLSVPNIFGISSINGSQPTGKASYQVSTLTAGVAYIPQGNVAWPLSGDIPVTAGHVYRISGNCALSNAGGTGHTTFAVSGGGAGFPQFIHSYPNSLASPGNNGLAGGVAGIVTPNASPLQIVGYNTDNTQSTGVEFYYLNWLVEDLGTNL